MADDAIKGIIEIENEIERREESPLDEKMAYLPPDFSLVKKYAEERQRIKLDQPNPQVIRKGFYETIMSRQSCREIDPDKTLSRSEVSTLLYLTAGVRAKTNAYGVRTFPLFTSPSSGGLQGVDIYVALTRASDLPPGMFYYEKIQHCLVSLSLQECYPSSVIAGASYGQWFVSWAPVVLVFVVNLSRGTWKYNLKYYKHSLTDVGVMAQNAHLVATAMGLCSCMVAGFDRTQIAQSLGLGESEIPALLLTVGYGRGHYG